MEPRDVTRELLKAVETESGFPVHVREDADLATVASVRLARDPLPAHMISYRPDGKRVLDYLICYQCGFVLRHFAAPPAARGDARSTVAGEAAVHELVRDLAGPEGAQAELTLLYLGGLITHVRSIPVGLRVAAWLAEHYPVLREQQEEAVLRELAEAQVSLEPTHQARSHRRRCTGRRKRSMRLMRCSGRSGGGGGSWLRLTGLPGTMGQARRC